MYRIIQDNHVVAICDRFRWVRMMDGVLVALAALGSWICCR